MNNYKVKFYITPRHSSHSHECNQEEKSQNRSSRVKNLASFFLKGTFLQIEP